ncbi:MAG: trypsin-like peptidase domain-containing protein [Planktotalea sp.]|mgnify:FL=1|jgi:Do/DeqQ family serine protease|uniref:trypsin-like peptidase domain-containing protein n=1 Tax=Planktotalea sp. TaxID=2029877 RepID=UPI000183BF41|nr:trypsin-like peptidase domain-containing protein [Planktotalea sp.]EDZ41689.1 periplasmic serine protease, DO/DeqQ family [Rhodobacteraceae bacterium HTCC2083]MBT5821302.1 PDZ domain-containing protein [Paracoccaceae bacterium]MDG1075925.1 trypsin-like peptidase domain-containing protein [Planktotalea sp.]MDG1084744.1 trypsin-like peptidase domain-containing protein [Planktotalea sp.]
MFRALILSLFLSAPIAAAAQSTVPTSQAQISLSFAPLVRDAAPAVVNIYAKRIVETRVSPFASDPFFKNFFGDLGPARPRVQNSLGSGVILSRDGFMVSNYHVVGGASDIRVVLKDRREFSAEVLLGDKASDLAILRLKDAEDLPFLSLRDSNTVEVGELTLAIGNPFGVGQTVSSGIISGLARSGAVTGNERGYFIQTDAPINPGNSGGALIGMDGALIGVNTAIVTRSGGSNGIGFAIPAALVDQFVTQARAGETRFRRPWAGMGGQTVDADLASSLGLERAGGMAITQVQEGSPFAAVGLGVGDVIVAAGGREVNSPSEMLYYMTVAGIGAEIDVRAIREGRVAEYTVAMIGPPDLPPREDVTLGERDVLQGMKVANVNPAVLSEYQLPILPEGVVVLETGLIAPRVGVQRGDILREIDGRKITVPADVVQALSTARRSVSLVVERGGQLVLLRFRL